MYIDDSFSQPLKLSLSQDFNGGIVTVMTPEFKNASLPIDSNDFGRLKIDLAVALTLESLVQFLKV